MRRSSAGSRSSSSQAASVGSTAGVTDTDWARTARVGPIARDTLPVWLPTDQRVVLTALVHAWRPGAPFDARAAIAPALLRQAKAA